MTDSCPSCKSQVIKKNGYTRHGKQNYRCLECGRQFSVEPPPTHRTSEPNQKGGYVECRIVKE